MKKESIDELANALLVQKNQTDNIQGISNDINDAFKIQETKSKMNSTSIEDLNIQVEGLLNLQGLSLDDLPEPDGSAEILDTIKLSSDEEAMIKNQTPIIRPIEILNSGENWPEYIRNVHKYAKDNGLDLSKDPFESLLTPKQRLDILKRIDEEFKQKRPQCDKYDYMVSATCGAIGGLIDVFFVNTPGDGALGRFTDGQIDQKVQKFAEKLGWQGANSGSDPTKSATGFLERKFRVNYDHRHSGDVDDVFNMSTRNHHLKSLAHSPSPVGLFFSILGQFTDTAHFVDSGKIIEIETGTMQLHGGNIVAKIFCGIVNWFGHLMSDVAGSSGTVGRGSGIPIPFYELLQFLNIGKIGKQQSTVAEIAITVFQEGYDFRHGLAMAIPVLVTELSIRFIYGVKSYFSKEKTLKESLVYSLRGAEIRRMLLVGHGTLCLIDLGDAALRSGGEPVNLLLHTNFVGWVRFGHLGFQEVLRIMKIQKYDIKAMDEALDKELKEIIVVPSHVNRD